MAATVKTLIINKSPAPWGLPSPYRGIIARDGFAVIADTKAHVIAFLLGTAPIPADIQIVQVVTAEAATFHADGSQGIVDALAAGTHDIALNAHKLTGVADPTAAQDAATKAYADALKAGLGWKPPVRLASAAALPAYTRTLNTLLANANGALGNIDGIAVVAGDRILLKDGAAGADNGIYDVVSIGGAGKWSMTRATDFDSDGDAVSGSAVFVSEGATLLDKIFVLTTNAPITLNTTSLTFAVGIPPALGLVGAMAAAGVAAANSAGVGATASAIDHAHAHGNNLGGTLHALGTEAAAGFAPAATRKIALTIGAEGAEAVNKRRVVGQVTDLAGTNIASAVEVLIRSLAVTADKGDLEVSAVPVGTLKKANNPATGENVAWFTTDATGGFAFLVGDDQVEDVYLQVTATNALSVNAKTAFA